MQLQSELRALKHFTKEEKEDIAKWCLYHDLRLPRAPFFMEIMPKFVPFIESSPLERAKYIFAAAQKS